MVAVNTSPPINLRGFAWYQLLEATRLRLRLQALLWGAALALSLGAFSTLAVGFLASVHVFSAWALLVVCVALVAAVLAWSLVHALRASTHVAAARYLASRLPSLNLGILSAWELARSPEDVAGSPALVHAFWENLEKHIRASGLLAPPGKPLPQKWLWGLGVSLGLCCFLGIYFDSAWKTGLQKMRGAEAAGSVSSEPIAGEFMLRYRFPEYTGLPALAVQNSSGEISVLQGSTIEWEARADRKVRQARLIINGSPLPLEVRENRKLRGAWVASVGGSYHIEFLSQGKVTAQSPPIPLHVEMDNPPTVRLLSPESPLSLAPEENSVLLRFEASDDYGLSSLELHASVDNQTLEVLPLPLSGSRLLQGEFLWDLSPLALLPGQTVHYSLVAKDNDAGAGNKEGLSQTQILQKFSPAMHQKMAMDKTQRAWKQLLAHAADRIESGEMSSHASSKPSASGRGLDEQAKQVAATLEQTSKEILQDEQAPKALAAAFENASKTLLRMADNTAKARQNAERVLHPESLFKAVSAEVSSMEHHLLYLEDLLGQFRREAASEFGNLLKSQLAELKSLLSQHQRSENPEEKAALAAQIQKLKTGILDLFQRVSEMSTAGENVDDDEVDWSANFQEEARHSMESLETALAGGQMDEALRQTESMLSQLDNNTSAQEGRPLQNAQANAELMEEFENFRQALESVLTEQEALLKKTQGLYEKQREKAAKELAQKNQAARPELGANLETLRNRLKSLNLERMTAHEQNLREEALQNVDMMKSALDSNDASLASDIVKELVQKTDELAAAGKRQEDLDSALGNSPEERQRSKQTREASLEGAEKARDFQERLRTLFGQKSGISAEGDPMTYSEPAKEQEALGKRARQVQRQMGDLSDKAPLFSEEVKERMEQVVRHMEKAATRIRMGNAQEGQSEQAQATQGLQALKKHLQAGGTEKASLPMPSASGSLGQGIAQSPKRLAIPKNTAMAKPHLRKELLETMRQGVPEGYVEPVRRYYEELVK
jgi:hypothetical protein